MNFMRKKLLIVCFLAFIISIKAEIKLPRILGDNMVLQRDIPVNIWGWTNAGEKVVVEFNNQKLTAKADANGNWKVQFKPMKAGGPYEMKITGKNQVILKNILIGDIWVCSGQSNMEWPLINSRNGEQEVQEANYPSIRLFSISRRMGEKPLNDLISGEWKECSPATVANFSAVGYLFGRNLHKTLNVPIGLINTNWGGTNVQSWMEMSTLYDIPEYKASIDLLKTKDFSVVEDEKVLMAKWAKRVSEEDLGIKNNWQKPETDVSKWASMNVPMLWESSGLSGFDGVIWFRYDIELTAKEAEAGVKISLGKIDDDDYTYLNGQLVGNTNDYAALRAYNVPAKMLVAGKNTIVVRIVDHGGGGGFYGDPSDMYILAGNNKRSLAGEWKYSIGINLPSPMFFNNPNTYPSSLYNAMIFPLTNFGIKGAIWYQGEANVGEADKYQKMLSQMITSWRKAWNVGDFPFIMVQLANFNSKGSNDYGDWAALREAQYLTTISVPNTGMAVAIDIGEGSDIHPRNKQDVGYRLSLVARKIGFGEQIVANGPVFKSFTTDGNKLLLSFDNATNGFFVKDKYGYIKGFEVCGADKQYKWAKAQVTADNKILVWSDEVTAPKAVRYAWSDNPDDVNLYNKEMLPAVPFRSEK
jgi:sialate O-acetylesterase